MAAQLDRQDSPTIKNMSNKITESFNESANEAEEGEELAMLRENEEI